MPGQGVLGKPGNPMVEAYGARFPPFIGLPLGLYPPCAKALALRTMNKAP
jgi:hypothetical protein